MFGPFYFLNGAVWSPLTLCQNNTDSLFECDILRAECTPHDTLCQNNTDSLFECDILRAECTPHEGRDSVVIERGCTVQYNT